jgi:hypothetical protein
MNTHEPYAASSPLPVSSLGHGSLLSRLRFPALIGASFDFVVALGTREHLALPTFAKAGCGPRLIRPRQRGKRPPPLAAPAASGPTTGCARVRENFGDSGAPLATARLRFCAMRGVDWTLPTYLAAALQVEERHGPMMNK